MDKEPRIAEEYLKYENKAKDFPQQWITQGEFKTTGINIVWH